MKTSVIFIIILIITAIINFLLLSKFSFGDDRDRKIFNKTCSHTLIAFIIYLLLDIILPFTNSTDSFTNLFVISFLFLINQLVYRKKFSWFLIKNLKFGTKKIDFKLSLQFKVDLFYMSTSTGFWFWFNHSYVLSLFIFKFYILNILAHWQFLYIFLFYGKTSS